MVKILFVCHGNICRSPMAEYMFRYYVDKKGLSDFFYIASAATSYEEIGNPVHYGTRKILNSLGIDPSGKRARRMVQRDYEDYDFLIGMDGANLRDMYRLFGKDRDGKIMMFLDHSKDPRPIADPWYTGNFDETYLDIKEGCETLLQYFEDKGLL